MPIGSIRCVVFDLDDTLWNTVHTLEKAQEVMSEALSAKRPELQTDALTFKEEMRRVQEEHPEKRHDFTFCRHEVLRKLTGDDQLAQEVFQIWHRQRNSPTLFPGALDAIRSLKSKGVSIGTLTDGNANPFTIDGLKDVIDFAVNAVEAGAPKPDRRMFALCESKAGLGPEAMVMVGDNPAKDVEGALDAGWRAIWVRPPEPSILRSAFDVDAGGSGPALRRAHADVDHVSEAESGRGLPDFLGIGIQYDLDSGRLVGVLTSASTARVRMLRPWVYYLWTAFINTINITHPKIEFDEELPILNFGEQMSEQFMAWTTNSAIFSRNGQGCRVKYRVSDYVVDFVRFPVVMVPDVFVFCQAEPAGLLKNTKSRVYFISIPDAVIIEAQGLDFTVLQLMVNEKHRDVIAVGHRSGNMMIVMIARIYFNTLENAKRVEWLYTPALSGSKMDLSFGCQRDFGDLFLTPGLAVSEHLFNKSFIMVRKYPVDWLEPREPELYPPILMEINIREPIYFDWCPADCQGTVTYKSPYTRLGSWEPRIPLSLAAPALVYARFSMEAVTIDVKFDRATLRGALPLDTTNDIVPDIIDYTTQLTGDAWDCANTFDEDTVILLGPFPETSCKWAADDLIQISLPRLFDIQVGDQIFLQADTIYTIPRPQDNEYSMAAQGGIAISLPDPLEEPVVIITGTTEIDECSPLQLSASDSYFLGGQATYRWELLSYRDLTNNPAGRIFNQTALDLFRFVLENATNFNDGQVVSPPNYLEEAVGFMINLTVTSRWGLSKSELVEVTKLDFPAPMVSILGPKELLVNRTEQVSLLANGVPSECATVSRQLGYRWSETTGQLDLPFMDGIVYTTRSLVIPPFVLEPIGSGSDVNMYNFTVETFAVDNPSKAAYASVTVRVRRSPVFAALATEDRLMTRGDILVLDARQSQEQRGGARDFNKRDCAFSHCLDPDYPTNPGMTFVGTFTWWCLTPGRLPCFGSNGTGLIPPLETCITDFDSRIVQGGMTFSLPLFDEGLYCRWARGVLMVSTVNFTEGEYLFEVQAQANDGRRSSKAVRITITELVVPQILLAIDNPMPKFPVTTEISISGTVESELDPTVELEFSWRILVFSSNPLYDGDLAREAESDNDPTTVYLVDKMVYIDQTDVYDVTNASRFFTRPDSPNMIIKGNVLQEDTIYKVRLVMTVGGGLVEGFSDVSLQTAGLPPRSGTLISAPLNATMDTKRVISAPDWVANDLPLNYQFGYIHYLGVGLDPITVRLNTAPQRVQQIEVEELPIGEPSTGFSLEVFVDVITPFGATTTRTIQVFSLPPKNATAIINRKMDEARTSDPETAVNTLMTIININQAPPLPPGVDPAPEDTAVLEQVREVMIQATAAAPVTMNTATNQAVVTNALIDQGLKDVESMNLLEDLVQRSAAAGLFDINDPSLITARGSDHL
ncbi:unnamed protein product, partial [Symbiodinium microadriaticum]